VVDDLVAIDPRGADLLVPGSTADAARTAPPIAPVVGAVAVALAATHPGLDASWLRAAAGEGWSTDVAAQLGAVVATSRHPQHQPTPVLRRRRTRGRDAAAGGGATNGAGGRPVVDAGAPGAAASDPEEQARATWRTVGAMPRDRADALVLAEVAGRDATGVACIVHRPADAVGQDLEVAWAELTAGWGDEATSRLRDATAWAWRQAAAPPGPPPAPPRPSGRAIAAVALAIALLGAAVTATADDPDEPEPAVAPTTIPGPDVADDLVTFGWDRVEGFDRGFVDAVAAVPDGLLAVGSLPLPDGRTEVAAIWESTDGGRTWDGFGMSTSDGDSRVRGVAASPEGVAVAVGVEDGHSAIWRRAEAGGSWEQVLVDRASDGGLLGVAYGAAGFVAVGSVLGNGTVLMSRDGVAWERMAPPDYGPVSGVAADPRGGYVILASTANQSLPSSWWSADGRLWRSMGFRRAGLTWTGTRFVVASLGDGEVVLEESFDGQQWNELGRTAVEPVGRDPGTLVLAAGPGGYVLTSSVDGQHPAVTVSSDGATWTPVPHQDQRFPVGSAVAAAAWTDAGPVLVGTSTWVPATGAAAPSSAPPARATDDATVWTELGPVGVPGSTVLAAATSGARIVAVGRQPAGDGAVASDAAAWWSDDEGVTWTAATVPAEDRALGPWTSAAVVPTGFETPEALRAAFVAVADGVRSGLWWSRDGTTWERSPASRRTFADAQLVFASSYGDRVFVGGRDADGAPALWSSIDGATWEHADLGGNGGPGVVRAVSSGPAGFVAVGEVGGYGAVWVGSGDPHHWASSPSALPLPPLEFASSSWNQSGSSLLAVARGEAGEVQLWRRSRHGWARVDDPRRTAGVTGPGQVLLFGSHTLVATRDGRPWIAEFLDPADHAPGAWAIGDLPGATGPVALVSSGRSVLALGDRVWRREDYPGFATEAATGPAPLDADGWAAGWHAVDPGPLGARYGVALAWAGTGLFAWGGAGIRGVLAADGAIWDPVGGTWQAVPPAPIRGRSHASAVWTGDRVLVWGGRDLTGQPIDDGAVYDPATGTWTAIPPLPVSWPDRDRSAPVWTGSELVLVALGVAWDPGAGHWRTLAADPAGLVAAPGTGATWTGRELVLVGDVPGGPTVVWAAEAYDPATDTWRGLPAPSFEGIPTGGFIGIGTLADGTVVVSTAAGEVARLRPDAEAWEPAQAVPLPNRLCEPPTVIPVGPTGDAPATAAVACGGSALATLEADGSWLVHARSDEGWFERAVATPYGVAAWGDALAVWGRPGPGELAELSVGLTTIDVAAAGITTAIDPGDDDADGSAVVATFTTVDGAACTLRSATNLANAQAELANLARSGTARLVQVVPSIGGPTFGALAVDGPDGVTLSWGDNDWGARVDLTCPDEATVLGVAAGVTPASRPMPLLQPR
jgi:hypothetical protein